MNLQSALSQLFTVCALSAMAEAVAGEGASGLRAICGLSVALTALRLVAGILE